MLSPAEPLPDGRRRTAERLARALAIALLLWLLLQSVRGSGTGRIEPVSSSGLSLALRRWSTTAPPGGVHLAVDADLSPAQRDWLTALGGVGASISWEGRGVLPIAATAEPTADPAGGTRILAAAPNGAPIALSDRYGLLDSIAAGEAGASFVARSGPAAILVRTGALSARATVRDSLTFGRILVFGRAGWETKFVIAALEERGWKVDARLTLSPQGGVAQGPAAPIDTARYAAVVLLDTLGLPSAALVAYVRSGGGAVISTPVVGARGLGGLGPVTVGARRPATEPFDTAGEPRRSLELTPILAGPEQIPLDRRANEVAVAAWRVGRGRVAILGYQDTWRWRMAGGRDAVERHRTWWADLIGAVAHVRRIPRADAADQDEAPLAHLVDRFGSASPGIPPVGRPRVAPAWLFGALMALLLLEWASRRLRGAA